jgi:plasmid stabilization system protein ParE
VALTIYWTKRADKRFDRIIGYLYEEWGEVITKAFVKKVYDFLDILIEFPEIGSVEHAEREIKGFVIVKQLTLFYKIKEDKIILLNFFDNRQDPKRKKY